MMPTARSSKSREATETPGPQSPKVRRFQGSFDWTKIANADPARSYKFLSINDPDSLERHVFDGWICELKRKGGPNVGAGVTGKDGEPVTLMGQHLYSIDKAVLKDQKKFGSASGLHGVGEEYYDLLEQKILDPANADDALRGLGARRFAHVEHDKNLNHGQLQVEQEL